MTVANFKHALMALIALVALACAGPAAAVIDGVPDGARHPYAGAVDGRPVGGPVQFGSGVLVSPTVFLSVGHGTARFEHAGLTRARVTFDPVVSASSTWYEGTVHTSPFYDPAVKGNRGDFGDLGVIVFDQPIHGITPATLPTGGYLDQIARGLGRARFEIPGYGLSGYVGGSAGGGKRVPDFNSGGTRRLAEEAFTSLSPGFLRLRATGSADICTGDSGSPSILSGTNLVLGVTAVEWSLAGSECESSPWEQRVDTPAARAFLSQYLSLP
jgi:V8-like Glu-specific endopeptidase